MLSRHLAEQRVDAPTAIHPGGRPRALEQIQDFDHIALSHHRRTLADPISSTPSSFTQARTDATPRITNIYCAGTRSSEVQRSTGEYKIKPIKKKVRELLGYPYPIRIPKGVLGLVQVRVRVTG
jgi:hypothetical protein